MRQIGSITEEILARKFISHLLTQGIEATTELDGGQWDIWVREEDQLEMSRTELDQFIASPHDERYEGVEAKADAIRFPQPVTPAAERDPIAEMRNERRRRNAIRRRRPMTFVFIFICIVLAFMTQFGAYRDSQTGEESVAARALKFRDPAVKIAGTTDAVSESETESETGTKAKPSETKASETKASETKASEAKPSEAKPSEVKPSEVKPNETIEQSAGTFYNIARGEVWRLITPIFLHNSTGNDYSLGVFHLFINMYILFYFGSMIEDAYGQWRYLALILLFAILSNVLQALMIGWDFVGTSGVVYGLFGYALIKAMFEPKSGIYVSQFTAIIFIAWIGMGFAGVEGMNMSGENRLANLAHAGGLIAGIACAFLPQIVRQQARGDD